MESHKWEEVQGPNLCYKYYCCTECGVYIAEVDGEIVSWSLQDFDMGNLQASAQSRLALLYRDPSCSDVREIRNEFQMDDALK